MNRKRRILFITPSFSNGGAEKNILNIINSLLIDEIDIFLIICTNEVAYLQLLNKKINIYVLDKPNIKKSLLKICNLIRIIRPDLIFTSALHLSIPIVLFKKFFFLQFKKVIRIPTLPSNKLEKSSIKTMLLSVFRKNVINASTVVVAQTAQMKEEIIAYYNVQPQKVMIINNIVDVITITEKAKESVDLPKDFFYFVAAGSLYSVKGFDLLIKAFAIFIQSFPENRLLIMGKESVEKGYRQYLEDLIKQLKIEDSVVLLGHQENPYKYFNFSNAFVLSSLKEGFPNVVLENLVLNKPVIVTDCIDFNGIVNDTNGIVVKKGDIQALVEGMKKIQSFDVDKADYILTSNFDYNCWFKKVCE